MEAFKKIKLDTDELLDAFKLKRNHKCEVLGELLGTTGHIEPEALRVLEQKRQRLIVEGDFWNEEELKMHFLAFLFDFARIDEEGKIKLFYERPLSAILGEYKITVKCDALIATPKGIGTPKKPYFFLQEFKKQKRQEDDAEGQMLAAMLIAQHENATGLPVYGAYLQGKNWTFTTLHERNYCVSKQFDATDEADLHQILLALRQLKVLILRQLD
ncbi:MAG: hypothetical protein ACK4Q5_04290 [Saprospiraceae bacterium]